MMSDEINNNYLAVLERISTCARKAGRDPSSIHLIVVTKGQSAEKINQVITAGAVYLGENYPEETMEKTPLIKGRVEWHMIGHLQSRKIKYIVDQFSMIHSIDRDEIAKKLDAHLAMANKTMPALFEVNLSGEKSKSGYSAWDEDNWEKLCEYFKSLMQLKHLHFRGLMTMPPFTDNPEESRNVFQKCQRLMERIQLQTGNSDFVELSMGTSLDYGVAIEQGATFIRVGEAIMGKRNYQ